ncbi:MAG: stage III sporulation protein AF [Lachnospiraceae bacterium]|nr:stage III sporulation protein AF [Lachnospiraceae bacterium]
MAENILEFMKKIAVFMIIAQTILHFRPNKSYEKYLKMLIGIMVLAIFIVPVTEFFREDTIHEYELLLEGYEKSIDRMYESAEYQIVFDENTYLYTLEEEIKYRFNNISKQYGYTVETVNLTGVQDVSEGMYKTVAPEEKCVQVRLKGQNNGISTVQVDKIKLRGNKIEKVSGEVSEEFNEVIVRMRQEFAESIDVPAEVIRIQYVS